MRNPVRLKVKTRRLIDLRKRKDELERLEAESDPSLSLDWAAAGFGFDFDDVPDQFTEWDKEELKELREEEEELVSRTRKGGFFREWRNRSQMHQGYEFLQRRIPHDRDRSAGLRLARTKT